MLKDNRIVEPEPSVVRKRSFEKANLVLASVALSIAFVNLVPTIYFFVMSFDTENVGKTPSVPQLMLSFALAVFSVTIICGILFHLYLKEHRKTADLRLELGLLKKQEGLTAEQRDLNIYFCRVIEYLLFKRAGLKADDHAGHELFLRSLVNNVKNVFDRVSGSECAVCIKSVAEARQDELENGEEGDIYVKTMCRDRASYGDRNGNNNESWYPIRLNTGFHRIISQKYKNSYFLENDLPKLAAEGNYNNGNENWNENYTATVIVPIGNSEGNKARHVRAFLCVDSLDGIFTKDQSVNILRVFSQIANQFPIDLNNPKHQPK